MEQLATRPSGSVRGLKLSQLSETWIILLVLGVFFAIYALSPVTTSTDSAYTFHVAASILHDGDIRLDEYSQLLDLKNDYRVIQIRGHIYSYYPSATPLMAIPVTWVADQLFPLRYGMDFRTYLLEHAPDQRTARLELWTSSFITSLFCVLIFLIGRQQGLDRKPALLLTLIAGIASPMYSTSSRALWQHGPSALALVLAIYLLLRYRASPERHSLLYASAVALALSYFIRPTNSISVIFLSLYVLLNHRAKIIPFLAIMGALFVLFSVHSYSTYGSLLPPYSFQLFNRFGSFASFLDAFAGLVVSPNRGLLIFCPIFFFSLYGIQLKIRAREFSRASIEPYLVGILLAHWVLTATFEQWDGGWTLGPRYMADMTGYLVILLIPVIGRLGGTRRLSIPKVLFAASLLTSLAIQAYVSIDPNPFYWTGKPVALTEAPERVWDWGDLQFLRGTCIGDPREGRAPACWLNPWWSQIAPQ